MEQCYACVEAFAGTPIANSGLLPEPAPESAPEPVPEPVARARRPCATEALSRINGIIEWETCAEDSELFQAQARAMDEEFKQEEDVLESEEEQDIEDSDNESEYESEDESEYESSFIDDSETESSEGEYIPPRKKLRPAESSDEDSAVSAEPADQTPMQQAASSLEAKPAGDMSPCQVHARSSSLQPHDMIPVGTWYRPPSPQTPTRPSE